MSDIHIETAPLHSGEWHKTKGTLHSGKRHKWRYTHIILRRVTPTCSCMDLYPRLLHAEFFWIHQLSGILVQEPHAVNWTSWKKTDTGHMILFKSHLFSIHIFSNTQKFALHRNDIGGLRYLNLSTHLVTYWKGDIQIEHCVVRWSMLLHSVNNDQAHMTACQCIRNCSDKFPISVIYCYTRSIFTRLSEVNNIPEGVCWQEKTTVQCGQIILPIRLHLFFSCFCLENPLQQPENFADFHNKELSCLTFSYMY